MVFYRRWQQVIHHCNTNVLPSTLDDKDIVIIAMTTMIYKPDNCIDQRTLAVEFFCFELDSEMLKHYIDR